MFKIEPTWLIREPGSPWFCSASVNSQIVLGLHESQEAHGHLEYAPSNYLGSVSKRLVHLIGWTSHHSEKLTFTVNPPGLDPPSFNLIGFAKLTRIVLPNNSLSFCHSQIKHTTVKSGTLLRNFSDQLSNGLGLASRRPKAMNYWRVDIRIYDQRILSNLWRLISDHTRKTASAYTTLAARYFITLGRAYRWSWTRSEQANASKPTRALASPLARPRAMWLWGSVFHRHVTTARAYGCDVILQHKHLRTEI